MSSILFVHFPVEENFIVMALLLQSGDTGNSFQKMFNKHLLTANFTISVVISFSFVK